MHLQNRPLSVWSIGPNWCHQPRARLPFQLDDNVADIGRVGDSEEDPAFDNIEVGVVFVRVVEVYLDEHDDRWVWSIYVK